MAPPGVSRATVRIEAGMVARRWDKDLLRAILAVRIAARLIRRDAARRVRLLTMAVKCAATEYKKTLKNVMMVIKRMAMRAQTNVFLLHAAIVLFGLEQKSVTLRGQSVQRREVLLEQLEVDSLVETLLLLATQKAYARLTADSALDKYKKEIIV